ncbi:MAG: hypothetical protein QM817_10630 [Archangium sp.]
MNSLRSLSLLIALSSLTALAQTSLVEVQAEPRSSETWQSSVLTGRTVGAGRFVVHPEIGYPGASVGLIWGQGDRFDLGVRFSGGYGTRLGFGFAPGFGAQAVMRWNFVNVHHFSFGARFEPGGFVGVWPGGGVLLVAPVGLDFGIHPHPIVNVAIGVDAGLGAQFDYLGRGSFVLPFAAGPGVELNITDHLALTLDTRMTAGWSTPWPDGRGYGLRATLGLAFKN